MKFDLNAAGLLLWQASQTLLVFNPVRCLPSLPLAPRKVPVWQVTHRLTKLLWLVSTVVQLATPLWQVSQAAVVGMWLVGLPVLARAVPWHAAQAVAGWIWVWSKVRAGAHFCGDLLWQVSHRLLVLRPVLCLPLLPLAVTPSWQLRQLVVMVLWSTPAGVQALVVWQVLQGNVVTTCVGPLPFLASLPVPSWQIAHAVAG